MKPKIRVTVVNGRHETRCYDIIMDPPEFSAPDWPKLRALGMCCRERTCQGQTSTEVIFFIGSRKASAKVYGKALRDHWSIENNLHWQLDVSFAEDHNRVSRRQGAENLAVLRRLALSLLKQNPAKESIACKRLRAALEPELLREILAVGGNLDKV
jgi:predicted transposase YbfD/YdcC